MIALLPSFKEHGGGLAAAITLPLLDRNDVPSEDRFISATALVEIFQPKQPAFVLMRTCGLAPLAVLFRYRESRSAI